MFRPCIFTVNRKQYPKLVFLFFHRQWKFVFQLNNCTHSLSRWKVTLMQPYIEKRKNSCINRTLTHSKHIKTAASFRIHYVVFRFDGSVQSNLATSEQWCKSGWNMDPGSSAKYTTKTTEKHSGCYNSNHINHHTKDKRRIKQTK